MWDWNKIIKMIIGNIIMSIIGSGLIHFGMVVGGALSWILYFLGGSIIWGMIQAVVLTNYRRE